MLAPSLGDGFFESLNEVGRRVSRDVLSLYGATGGMDNSHFDAYGFSMWPVNRIVRECQYIQSHDIPFADYLIDSWYYYFRYEDESRSSVWGSADFRQLASSVEQFFELYLTRPADLDLWL